MRRPRKHINKTTRLAAALACLLPDSVRKDLRDRRVPAEQVIRMFEMHHVVFHAAPFNGSDKWWNLDPQIRGDHRERSKGDASAIAKVKRIMDAPAIRAGVPKPAAGTFKPISEREHAMSRGGYDVPDYCVCGFRCDEHRRGVCPTIEASPNRSGKARTERTRPLSRWPKRKIANRVNPWPPKDARGFP